MQVTPIFPVYRIHDALYRNKKSLSSLNICIQYKFLLYCSLADYRDNLGKLVDLIC